MTSTLFRIHRRDVDHYDEYRGALVVATCEEDARRIHPNGRSVWMDEVGWANKDTGEPTQGADQVWPSLDQVWAEEVDVASLKPGDVIHTDWHDA